MGPCRATNLELRLRLIICKYAMYIQVIEQFLHVY